MLLGGLAALMPGAQAAAARALPTVVIADVSIAEGAAGSRDAILTVVRSGNLADRSTVTWTTADGSAIAPDDYTARSGTVTFAAKQASQTLAVPVTGDTGVEPDETFMVKLSAPVNATLTDDTAVGTIVNDDTAFAVDDVSVDEGNAGGRLATFTISRKGVITGTSSVGFATADGSATAPSDYCATSGRASFEPSRTAVAVQVCIQGDEAVEANETFTLQLAEPDGGGIEDGTGQGVIENDDQTLSVNDLSLTEGDSGLKLATFAITRSGVTAGDVSVGYATRNGTATALDDYCTTSGTATIPAGQSTASVAVCIRGDAVVEAHETFSLELSAPVGARIADATGVTTIVNDDAAFSIDDVSLREGHAGTKDAVFTITRTGALGAAGSVSWRTDNGTAGSFDIDHRSGTASFAPGVPSVQVRVPVRGDNTLESDETFPVVLGVPAGASIGDGTGIGTIINDDGSFAISAGSKYETSCDADMVFTVTRSGDNIEATRLHYWTRGATATEGVDYNGTSGTIDFAYGQRSGWVRIPVYGDIAIEGYETFQVELYSYAGYTVSPGTATGTIIDDDDLATFRSYQWFDHYIRHRNHLGELTSLPTEGDVADATFKPVPGLADPRGVSFESVNFPGWFLRHEDFRLKLSPRADTALFRADATFYADSGLAAPCSWSLSFRSYNHPTRYIRHQNFELYLHEGSDQLFREDSTFTVVRPYNV